MKRTFSIRWKDIAIALIATLVLQVPVSEARRLGPSQRTHTFMAVRHAGVPSLGRFRHVGQLRRYHPLSLPAQTAVSGSVTSSAQMKLPPSSFPDDFAQLQSIPQTAGDADSKIFSQVHTNSYTALGMMGGWWQYYSKRLPDGLFDVAYLGSYYRDRDAARVAFDDVATNLSFIGTISSCSTGERCLEAAATIRFSDGVYRGTFRVIQASNGLAEMVSLVPSADVSSYLSTIGSNLDRASTGFLGIFAPTQPTATPIPPTASPLPTATPVPTSIPPSPTAVATATSVPAVIPTASPAKATKKPVQCKKGYRLVHGKCKKKGH